MLVITRKFGESFFIGDGDQRIEVKVISLDNGHRRGRVKVGIQACC